MTEHVATQNATEEQRHQARYAPSSTVSVFRKSDKECIGLLGNCSEQGLLLLSTNGAFDLGERLEIEVVDVPGNTDNRRTGECTVEVMWSSKISSSMYGSGCRALELSDEVQQMFRSYRSESEEAVI